MLYRKLLLNIALEVTRSDDTLCNTHLDAFLFPLRMNKRRDQYLTQYERRVKTIRQRLEDRNLDAILIRSWKHIFYTTGIGKGSRSTPWPLVITRDRTVLIVPKKYKEMIAKDFGYLQRLADIEPAENSLKLITTLLKRWGLTNGIIGVEEKYAEVAFLRALKKHLPRAEFTDATRILEEMRMIKSREEISFLRKACKITDAVYEFIMENVLQDGITELRVARDICRKLIEEGSEGWAYFPIVRSGTRIRLFSESSEKRIRKKNMVLIDFGAVCNGYHADLTRMAVIGAPSQKQKEIFQIALDTQEKTIEMIRPGIKASDLDGFVRKRLREIGYLRYFLHVGNTGHGIGIEYHEKPFLKPGVSTTMRPGMTLAIEPGIFLSEFGARVENNVLVTKSGAETFDKCSKDLYVIS